MELRPGTCHKENVPLRAEPRSLSRSPAVGLNSSWGRRASLSPGASLSQEPCAVQTNLTNPHTWVHPGLALKLSTSQRGSLGSRQQSNLQPPTQRSLGSRRALPFQQHNLSMSAGGAECGRHTSPRLWPEPQKMPQPILMSWAAPARLKHPVLPAREGPCPSSGPVPGHTGPDSSSGCGLGEPLSLQDLAVPIPRWALVSPGAVHQLLASIQRLEQQVARLGYRPPRKSLDHAPGDPRNSSGPAGPLPSYPCGTSQEEKRQRLLGPREVARLPRTHEVRATPPDSGSSCQSSQRLGGDFLGPGQSANSPGVPHGGGVHPWLPGGLSGREIPWVFGPMLAGAEDDPWELASRTGGSQGAHSPGRVPGPSALQSKALNIRSLEPGAERQQLLYRCLRAWRASGQRRRAVAAAVALGRRWLLRKALRALRWAWLLREAQLEAAAARHLQNQLGQSFRKWRKAALQQGQRQTLLRADPGAPPPLARPSAVTLAWRNRCFQAWRQFTQMQTQQGALWHCAATLRLSWQQWVRLKRLRASDSAERTQPGLCLQEAGNLALCNSAAQEAMAQGRGIEAWLQRPPQQLDRGTVQEACRTLALHPALPPWKVCLCQRQWACSSLWATQQQDWHLQALGLGSSGPGSVGPASALGPQGSRAGGAASPGPRTPLGSLEKEGLLDSSRLSFLRVAGRRLQHRFLLLWRARAWQSRRARQWRQRTLQRRILLGWSRWAMNRGAQRALAARWAWGRSCRTTLSRWQQRLAQSHEAARWARARGQHQMREALHHWHACWHRRQALRASFQWWEQAQRQRLCGAMFRGWLQAVDRRRLGATRSEQVLLQRALEAWAQAAARGRVLRAASAQLQQARPRHLLRTYWAQWQRALPPVQPESQDASQAGPGPGTDCRHQPWSASRGCVLVQMDTPGPWTQALGLALPGPAPHHRLRGRGAQREASWAQREGLPPLCVLPLCLQWPNGGHRTVQPPEGGEGQEPAEVLADRLQLGTCLQGRHLEVRCSRLQASQRARRLAAAWQCWAGAREAEELGRTLLRQWRLRWAWRGWRRRSLQLWVARRLQRQEEARVLGQAFEKWHQSLGQGRVPRSGAAAAETPQVGRAQRESPRLADLGEGQCTWDQGQ